MRDARISSADPKAKRARPVGQGEALARPPGGTDFDGVAAVGSGLNRRRRRRLEVLKAPWWAVSGVEGPDRLGRFGFERVEAGKSIVGVEMGGRTSWRRSPRRAESFPVAGRLAV